MVEESEALARELEDIEFVIVNKTKTLRECRSICETLSGSYLTVLETNERTLLTYFARLLWLKRTKFSGGTLPRDAERLTTFTYFVEALNISSPALLARPSLPLDTLVQYSDAELVAFLGDCSLQTEDETRLLSLCQRMVAITRAWIAEGKQPDMSSDGTLVQSVVVEAAVNKPAHSLCVQPSESESTHESDSGVGSNVSQQSLTGATPPCSPLTSVSLKYPPIPPALSSSLPSTSAAMLTGEGRHSTVRGSNLANSTGKARRRRDLRFHHPSTPPPSHRLGVGMLASTARDAAEAGYSLSRSRSHEADLQHRVTAERTDSSSGGSRLNSESNAQVLRFVSPVSDDQPVFWEKPGSMSVSACETSYSQHKLSLESSHLAVPNSPGAGTMSFNIPHRWEKRLRPTKLYHQVCNICNAALGFTSYKCNSCKMRVHQHCRDTTGNTCGMSKEFSLHLIQMWSRQERGSPGARKRVGSYDGSIVFDQLSVGPRKGSVPEVELLSVTQTAADTAAYYNPRNNNPSLLPYSHSTSQIGGACGDSSSSSCNSTAPNTPGGLTFTAGSGASKTKTFNFPECPGTIHEIDVPDINVERPPHESVLTFDSDKTLSIDDNTSQTVTERGRIESRIMSHDSSQQSWSPSASINEDNATTTEEAKIKRDRWHTLREKSNSFAEWSIPLRGEDAAQGWEREESVIGRGRFGEVRRAYWHQPVAVKFVHMDHVGDEEREAAFRQEVMTFRNTRHENIILFLGCCMEPFGIFMNLCKGHTIYQHLHRYGERFDIQKSIQLASQIAIGMSYLHDKRIVHKDLRTRNIYVEPPNSKIIITDFGLLSVRRLMKSRRVPVEGKTIHTPLRWLCYVAPEIARELPAEAVCGRGRYEDYHLPFSFQSDIYAFGTVLYEMLCSEFPFPPSHPHTLIWQIASGTKPPLHALPTTVKEIKDILMICWSFCPEDRQSFTKLLHCLDKLPKRRGVLRSPSHPVHLSRSAEAVF